MITKDSSVIHNGLEFTHETQSSECMQIYVERVDGGQTGSLACCIDTGCFSDDHNTILTKSEYRTCEIILDWASKHDLY